MPRGSCFVRGGLQFPRDASMISSCVPGRKYSRAGQRGTNRDLEGRYTAQSQAATVKGRWPFFPGKSIERPRRRGDYRAQVDTEDGTPPARTQLLQAVQQTDGVKPILSTWSAIYASR
jgi:hypothetical protein